MRETVVEYKLKQVAFQSEKVVTKDGHTMFPEDIIKDLERLNYLESMVKAIGGTPVLEGLSNKCPKCHKDKNEI